MKFMCLVWFEPGAFDGMSEADGIRLTDETIVADHALRQSGHLIVSQPLQGPETAVTIKVRNGEVSAHDGPFIETKEWLGGFFLIEAKDLAEARSIVERDPITRIANVEIRPTLEQTHSETGAGRPEPAAS